MKLIIVCSNLSVTSLSGGMNAVLYHALPEFEAARIHSCIVCTVKFKYLIVSLYRLIKFNPFDADYIVFNATASISKGYWWVLAGFAKLFGIRIAFYSHEMAEYYTMNFIRKQGKIFHRLMNWAFNKKNVRFLSVSQANSMLQEIYFPKASNQIVYNTTKLNISGDRNIFKYPTVVTVGSIQEIKGADIWVDTAIKCCERNRDICFSWIGHGKASYKKALEDRVREAGFSDRILFQGTVSNPAAMLNKCSLFFSSSRMDSMPLAVIEAMAVGLNIVVFRSGGAPEAVGDIGYVIEDFSSELASRKILELIDEITSNKRDRINVQLQKIYAERFSPSVFAINFCQVLKQNL